ncbi:antibiotic biosynthesis monooxygenase [Salipiger sp. H15]|uniref:Antibiotic biosynthesis monooxygenase n=1 Tax=Alloyangia sp. H15 TaxID=3029062 RepID=A0AAU8AM10_9RHOB
MTTDTIAALIVLEAFEHVDPSRCADYETAAKAIDDKVKETEPGMLVHALTRVAEAPDRVTYRWLEIFDGVAALEAHFASPHVKEHVARMMDGILLSPVELVLCVGWSEAEKAEINARLGGALTFAEVKTGYYLTR